MSATAKPAADSKTERWENELSHNRVWIGLRGVIAIFFGIVAFFSPVAAMLALALLFSAYALVDGVLAIVAAFRAARRRSKWGLLALDGVVSILAGVLAFAWPGLTAIAFVFIVAAWSIISGALMVAAAFRLETGKGRWLYGLGGVLSVLFGALLVAAPLAGALVLTWWLGAYVLVFGAMLLAFALTKRATHDKPSDFSSAASA